MANAIYPKYKEALLTNATGSDIADGNVKVALIDTGEYTYSSTHEFLDDIASEAVVATSGNLVSKSITNGTFDSADFAFSAVTGATAEALVVYIDTGTPSTSRLVAYYDTGVTGLPVTPNGGDINVTVNASGWFTL